MIFQKNSRNNSVGGYMVKKMMEAQEENKDADNYNKNKKICIKRK
jgi:hypothetical protein